MKKNSPYAILVSCLMMGALYTQAQAGADSAVSAREALIKEENSRKGLPNSAKKKKFEKINDAGTKAKKPPKKKCRWFRKRAKNSTGPGSN